MVDIFYLKPIKKGKEYNTYNDNLIYEGEILNWKKMEKENNMRYMVI